MDTEAGKFAMMTFTPPGKVLRFEMHTSASSRRAPGPRLNLARFRKKAGVSLEQIAERTKISSRFLQAIENENFDELPGGIFSTSYLRQYASAVGYNEDALVAHYNKKINPPPAASANQTNSRGLFDRWFRTPAQAPR